MIVLDDAFLQLQARKRRVNLWWAGVILLAIAAFLLDWFDRTTELAPTHDVIENVALIPGGVVGLISAVVGYVGPRPARVIPRLFRAAGYGLIGFCAAFFLAIEGATIIAGWIDFPASATHSAQREIALARAHHHIGSRGGESWTVQTRSFDATLNITRADYGFMLAHRVPGDDASEPDDIASDGHFCARVTVEQAGTALRVMNAGSYTLPQGSVVICPAKGTI